MLDTQQLIERWQAGDESAAQLLYDQHRDRTYRLAYGLLGGEEDAEEVAQDALTYALVNIDKFRPDKSRFSTWLHTITVSRARDKYRKRKFSTQSLTDWMEKGRDVVDETPTPEAARQNAERRQTVRDALNTLKPSLREAVVLRYWSGHSFREIAEIMDCPLGTAQSRVRRAFEQLQDDLSLNQLAQLQESQT